MIGSTLARPRASSEPTGIASGGKKVQGDGPRPLLRRAMTVAGLALLGIWAAPTSAQQGQPQFTWDPNDPRVDLGSGWLDAEAASWNLNHVASLARPEGFFNPETPGDRRFNNTDLAFRGDLLFQGNYNGFQVYDISDPTAPEVEAFGRMPRRAGGRFGVRGPGLHVGPGDARPARLRLRGRGRLGEYGASSRGSHLRSGRSGQSAASRGGPDLPRVPHPYAGFGPQRSGPRLRLQLRYQHRTPG